MKRHIALTLLALAAGFLFAPRTAFAAGSVFQADDWTGKRKKTQEQWINTTDVKGPFSGNAETNNYETVNDVDKSFLVPFTDGSMMMVQAEKNLQIRYLDKGYHQTGERNIKLELPLFGGRFVRRQLLRHRGAGESERLRLRRGHPRHTVRFQVEQERSVFPLRRQHEHALRRRPALHRTGQAPLHPHRPQDVQEQGRSQAPVEHGD